ncbi:MAG TPA: hypothetical protein VFE06_14255, partial [Acidobacteriaceae bacterium]|nr:hypothetical protein [Acidobacteriaceae bacterium]
MDRKKMNILFLVKSNTYTSDNGSGSPSSMTRNSNNRLRELEDHSGKLRGQIERLTTSVDALRQSVGKNAAPAQRESVWTKTSAIAAAASVIITATLGVYGISQAKSLKKSLQGQVTRLQSDLRVIAARLAPELLSQIGQVETAALNLPSKDLARSLKDPIETLKMLRENDVPVAAGALEDPANAAKKLTQSRPEVAAV